MKRSLFVSLVACLLFLSLSIAQAAETIPIDSEHFPDNNFREYVLENLDTDDDGALSANEISKVDYLNVSAKNISSLKGVEYFTSLTDLYCSYSNYVTKCNKRLPCQIHRTLLQDPGFCGRITYNPSTPK